MTTWINMSGVIYILPCTLAGLRGDSLDLTIMLKFCGYKTAHLAMTNS